MFPIHGRKCLLRKAVHNWVDLPKRFAADEDVETEVRQWLRQQLKDFHAAGFDTLVRCWDKRINVVGG
jgi:hypothetical protein